jgi:Putative peptidoglycan binding domain
LQSSEAVGEPSIQGWIAYSTTKEVANMKVRQLIIAGAVSCSFGAVALAQQSQDSAKPSSADPTKPQAREQDRSRAIQPEPDSAAEMKAGRGHTEPDAQVKAKNEGAHSPPQTATSGDNQQVVRQVQEKLKEQGYNAGPADGVYGAKTRAALKDFQRSKNLDASGQIDQETLAGLGIEAEGAAGTAPGKDAEQGASGEGASKGAGMDKPESGAVATPRSGQSQ